MAEWSFKMQRSKARWSGVAWHSSETAWNITAAAELKGEAQQHSTAQQRGEAQQNTSSSSSQAGQHSSTAKWRGMASTAE